MNELTVRDVPQEIKSWFGSEKMVELITIIINVFAIEEKDESVIPKILFAIELKRLAPKDLEREIADKLKFDVEKRNRLVSEIRNTLLVPIKNQLLDFGIDIDSGEITSFETKKIEPQTPQIVRPAFLDQSAPAITEGQPFILHNEEESRPIAEPTKLNRELVRPSFYNPVSEDSYATTPNSGVAKLDTFGLSEENKKAALSSVFKIPSTDQRVVHYSELRTPLDPFSSNIKVDVVPTTPVEAKTETKSDVKKEIHPDNVINLRDLPK